MSLVQKSSTAKLPSEAARARPSRISTRADGALSEAATPLTVPVTVAFDRGGRPSAAARTPSETEKSICTRPLRYGHLVHGAGEVLPRHRDFEMKRVDGAGLEARDEELPHRRRRGLGPEPERGTDGGFGALDLNLEAFRIGGGRKKRRDVGVEGRPAQLQQVDADTVLARERGVEGCDADRRVSRRDARDGGIAARQGGAPGPAPSGAVNSPASVNVGRAALEGEPGQDERPAAFVPGTLDGEALDGKGRGVLVVDLNRAGVAVELWR